MGRFKSNKGRGRKKKYSPKTLHARHKAAKLRSFHRRHAKTATSFSQSRQDLIDHVTNSAQDSIPSFDPEQDPNDDLPLFAFNDVNEIDFSTIPVYDLGRFDTSCKHCGAKKWKSETNISCCNNGELKFLKNYVLPKPDKTIRNLLIKDTECGKFFRKNIRAFNSAFAMTSMKCHQKLDFDSYGPPTFNIHGNIVHRIGDVYPINERKPQNLQVYFYSTAEQIDLRYHMNNLDKMRGNLAERVLKIIQTTLQKKNKLVQLLKTVKDQLDECKDPDFNGVKIVLKDDDVPKGEHEGCYNLPSNDQVAAVIPGISELENINEKRELIIVPKDGGPLKHVDSRHALYDPLQYPLFHINGNFGWRKNLLKPNGKAVTLQQYYRFMVQRRLDDFNILHRGKQLFQQWVVDQFVRDEENRLNYQRLKQSKFRQSVLNGLVDAIDQQDANLDLSGVGTKTHLSSSFTGGRRYKHQSYMDSLAIADTFGKPTWFVTMTCNPQWPEIQANLLPNQDLVDAPDVVTRAFKKRYDEFVHDLTVEDVLGKCQAWTASIEWQKRGLPHVHFLLWVESKDQPKCPEKYDKYVCAELPDPEKQPELYKLVVRNMVHGPCNANDTMRMNGKIQLKHACCKKNKKCCKEFPKAFCNHTKSNEDGYPFYRRRSVADGGFTAEKNGNIITNEWIVPYNPKLLHKYKCHINVEICNSILAIKYLFKYTNKGPDMTTAEFQDLKNDEILMHSVSRYVGPNEACHRLLGFPIRAAKPTVKRLALHLPDQQSVEFPVNDLQQTKEAIEHASKTTLTDFFARNKLEIDAHAKGKLKRRIINSKNTESPFAFELSYEEFPIWYTHNRANGWYPKKHFTKIDQIGRMYRSHPAQGERFYLSLLLNETKGKTSFKDLRTVKGVVYPTFREACNALGLLMDDNIWMETMKDASKYQTAQALRSFFASLLAFNEPSNSISLWHSFKQDLSEDFKYKLDQLLKTDNVEYKVDYSEQDNPVFNAALLSIELKLKRYGKTLKDFNLPQVGENQFDILKNDYIKSGAAQFAFDSGIEKAKAVEYCSKFTTAQKKIFDEIKDSIYKPKSHPQNVKFINAAGGSGKTHICKALLSTVRANKDIAISVASSGIAALLLPGGTTAHSRFGIPVPVFADSVSKIKKESTQAKIIKDSKLIVWDESVMAHKHAIECIDRLLKDIMNNEKPFGGKTTVFLGDFRQILPVIPNGSPECMLEACIKNSYLWDYVEEYKLTQNLRVLFNSSGMVEKQKLQQFADWLLKLGDGKIPNKAGSIPDLIELPDEIVAKSENIQEFIQELYPNLSTAFREVDYFKDKCILAPKNDVVDEINEKCLKELETAEKSFKSIDYVHYGAKSQHYTQKQLNKMNASGLPPHELKLKIGAPIMILRNLDPVNGLCNGTRCIVTGWDDNIIKAKIWTNDSVEGKQIYIHRIKCTSNATSRKLPCDIVRCQFPVKLCFAMTINKSQGQTLGKVGLYLSDPVFCHGQLYVACSRVQKQEDLKIFVRTTKLQGRFNDVTFTQNIVYNSILH